MSDTLILCSDWKAIENELLKQLKPHGLKVKFKTRRQDDCLTITVSEIPKPKPPKTLMEVFRDEETGGD